MEYCRPDIEPDSGSSDDEASGEVSKYKENLDDQEHDEAVSYPPSNPSSLIWGNKIALIYLKSYIKITEDKIFFVDHISASS